MYTHMHIHTDIIRSGSNDSRLLAGTDRQIFPGSAGRCCGDNFVEHAASDFGVHALRPANLGNGCLPKGAMPCFCAEEACVNP